MGKLIVTADIHGSYTSWLTMKNLLKPSDKLAVAGDLFDTKYGNFSNTDFQPESIKNDLKTFKHPFYYVKLIMSRFIALLFLFFFCSNTSQL